MKDVSHLVKRVCVVLVDSETFEELLFSFLVLPFLHQKHSYLFECLDVLVVDLYYLLKLLHRGIFRSLFIPNLL